jgi:phage baseplate assembly protein W
MRKRPIYKFNPLDFERDVAIGLTLPLTNDISAERRYSYETLIPSGSSNAYSATTGQTPHNSSTKADNSGDFHQSYTTVEQTKSNIINLVLTNRGERPMHPNFGCDTWKSLFEPNTPRVREDLEDLIKEQIEIWIPYVDLKSVKVQQPHTNENRMNIKIDWTLFKGNTMDLQSIALEIGDL